MWWPHPIHGAINGKVIDELMTFECACGETFAIPLCVADEHGLLREIEEGTL